MSGENALGNEPQQLQEESHGCGRRTAACCPSWTPGRGRQRSWIWTGLGGPAAASTCPRWPRVAESDRAARGAAAPVRSPIIAGASNSAEDTTHLDCSDPGSALYVIGGGRGVSGVAQSGPGLHGLSYGENGVVGVGMAGGLNGVQGQALSPGAGGVYGQHDNGGFGTAGRSANIGVFGESTGNGAGVYGTSTDGHGVQAVSHNQSGVNGASVNSYGVRGFSDNSVGVLATTNSSTAAGLLAENDSGAAGGVAVIALGQAGLGVYASGEQAAVQLGRSSLAGAPATGFHNAGELVLDANADLYLCRPRAARGPGSCSAEDRSRCAPTTSGPGWTC